MSGAKNVALYARVSSEDQDTDDKVSVEQQLNEQEKLIERNKWTVIATFIDNQKYTKTKVPHKGKVREPSGEYDDRPAFLEMLALVKSGTVDAVICWRDDRLVRHPRVAVALEDALDEGNNHRTGKKPDILIYDANGSIIDRFTLGIKAQVWREENKRRAERIRLGKVGTLKRGLWPGPYHRLGYRTERAERGKRILLGVESEVQTVKDIFNWYDNGMNVAKIRKRLIYENRKQRGQPNAGKMRTWGPHAVLNILRSEDYTGHATWQFNDRESISIEIPQIISVEQFKRVQKRMKGNQRLSTRNTKGVYLLQHLAMCGGCGGRLTVAARSRFYYKYKNGELFKRYERQSDKGYRYFCSTAAKYPEEVHTKPYTFDGRELDEQFWNYVADKMVTHPELIIQQVRSKQRELQEQGDNLDSEIAKQRRQIKLIEQDRLTYTRQLSRGKISEDIYDSLIAECDEYEAEAEEELKYLLTVRDDAKKIKNTTAYAERILSDIRERLPEINQSPEALASLPESKQRKIMLERQKIIRGLCDTVIIYADGEITINGLIEVSDFEMDNPENSDRG